MSRILVATALAILCAAATPSALAAVNLNTASRDELVTVPGIGPAKAQAIVEHRKVHGPFKSVDDLAKVKGFREKLVERLRPELTVAAAPAKAAAKGEGAVEPRARPVAQASSGRIQDERPRK
ncbi:MAG: helix-hairpin-helix domain-containing protein [Betaproteobacteria bacterium]